MRNTSPFRADIVGSFLRPTRLATARADHLAGTITTDELRQIENDEITVLVSREENVGLEAATDGEFRRSWWHFDFFAGLSGVEVAERTHGIQFEGTQTRPLGPRVTGPIAFPSDHPMLDHFRFLESVTTTLPKMTIPSPTVLHFRLERDGIDPLSYEHRDDVFDDLAAAYRKAVQDFYDIGCRYLQFDDTAWAYLCSQTELEKAKERGIDIEGLPERYAQLINASIADKPADMTITTHVCRGNFRSTWISSGGYEPVAEQLLDVCNYDGYFLEYDTERAGGFEPLRFLPAGEKRVVLGLISSKVGDLEPKDLVRRRIDEATAFAPLEQLALSPQCGFASTEEGNLLTEDQQWAKVAEVVDIAADVWR